MQSSVIEMPSRFVILARMESTSPSTAGAESCAFDAQCAGWVKAMAAGEEHALEAFYRATLGKVYGVAMRIVHDESIAEDIVTDVYYQVWTEAARYDEARGRPITWLLTICRSRALDRIRRDSRAQRAADAAAVAREEATGGTEELLQSLEAGSKVRSVMATLAQVQRDVLALAYFRDLSHQQIADYLGLPLGTVKTHIRKALQTLRPALAEARQ